MILTRSHERGFPGKADFH